jgi:hypothetical protein
MFHQLEGSHVFLAASPCFDVDSQDPETVDYHPIFEIRIQRNHLMILEAWMGEAIEAIPGPNLNSLIRIISKRVLDGS